MQLKKSGDKFKNNNNKKEKRKKEQTWQKSGSQGV